MLVQNINLVKQIPNKSLRDDILRAYWGIIPCDGKIRSIKTILENQDKYGKLADQLEKRGQGRKK